MPEMTELASNALPSIPLSQVPAEVAENVEEIVKHCATEQTAVQVTFSDAAEKRSWQIAARSYCKQRDQVAGVEPAGVMSFRLRGGRKVNGTDANPTLTLGVYIQPSE